MLTVTVALWLVVLGIGFGFVLTRLGRSLALRVGLVDTPDRQRKIQSGPIPIVGGVAVLAAAVLSLIVTVLVIPEVSAGLAAHQRQTFGLLGGAALIVAVGIADDRYNLRARYKVLGQLSAILVLTLGGGFVIERVGLFGMDA